MSDYFQESQAIIEEDEFDTSLEDNLLDSEMGHSSPISSKRKSLNTKNLTRAPKKIKVKK